MLFNLYISNKIGSEAVGTFSLVMSVYWFAITLATSGLSLACTYIVSEQFSKRNFSNGIQTVKNCFFFSLLLGLGSSLFLLLFAKPITNYCFHGILSTTPLYFIGFSLPFISVSSVLHGYFSAVRKGYKSAFSQLLELFLKILATIFLFHSFPTQDVETICICLIVADIFSEIFSCCVLFILYQIDKKSYNPLSCKTMNFKKEIFHIILPVSITSFIRSSLSTLKQFLISSQLVAFGFPYSVALSEYGKINGMTMAVLLFPNLCILSFSNLLIPEFSSLLAKQYKKRILEICHKVFWVSSIFSISISLIFFFFANRISLLLFKNLACANYIKILSPLILFMYLDSIIDSMLKGLNKQFQVMICNIIDLILMISMLYFFLPSLGITGYLLTITISEIFNFSISFFQLHHATGFKMQPFLILSCLFFLLLGIYQVIYYFL